MTTVAFYRSGQCRNDETALSHTYAEMSDGGLLPMCGYGWNRANGEGFSILRGSPGSEGDCKLCARRVRMNYPPVEQGIKRKTRWL